MRIKKKLAFKASTLWLCAALTVFNIFVVINQLKPVSTNFSTITVIITSIILELGLLFTTIKMQKKNIQLEKIFLAIIIPLGLLFIALLPCGESPDEATHFYRIYGISEGVLLAKKTDTINGGSNLPEDIDKIFVHDSSTGSYDAVSDMIKIKTSSETQEVDYVTAAVYNPLCYLPQVLGVLFGKLIHSSILVQAYISRIFNFCAFLILAYFAIKLIPKYKKFLVFVLLFPITLQEATSLAPDALTIGLAVFLIAFVLNLTYVQKKTMDKKQLLILYLIAITLGFCKIVYLPLLLLYFIIPSERFGGKKKKIIHASTMIVLVLALNLSWLIVSSQYLVAIKENVRPDEQLSFILQSPIRLPIVIFRSIIAQIDYLSASLFGMSLGHFQINLPRIYFYLIFITTILILIRNSDHLPIKNVERFIIIASASIILILIFTSLYLQWTPVKSEIVDGVQGRYFIPILPLLPVILSPSSQIIQKNASSEQTDKSIIAPFAVSIFIDACALICIFSANI